MRVMRIAGPWWTAALSVLLVALLAVLGAGVGDPATSGTRAMARAVHACDGGNATAPTGYQVRDHAVAPASARVFRGLAAKPARVDVRVHVHVLRTVVRGGVPRSRIARQLVVLNNAYAGAESPAAAGAPFHFVLASVDVTRNKSWFRMNEGSPAEAHAKHALHRGGATELNLYIGGNSAGLLGWGTQPTRVNSQPMMDGVVVARHTLPGGKSGSYSSGDTAVHETGHWLGLFHTYTGKCESPGDRVADTPREARPSYECPKQRNTCAAPGRDPVHNFMDAGTDACMNQFTHGQVSRMVYSWNRFRAKISR